MTKYVVRVREEVRGTDEVDPVTVEAESAVEAARTATGFEVHEVISEDEVHDAIAVVTTEALAETETPKYFRAADTSRGQ